MFLFFVVFIKKLFIKEGAKVKDSLPMAVVLAISLILVAALWDRIYLPSPLTPDMMLWLIGMLIIILILVAVYTHNPEK